MSAKHKGMGIAAAAAAAPFVPHVMKPVQAVHPVHAASLGLASLMTYLIVAELRAKSK
jgi:hypothetical protein